MCVCEMEVGTENGKEVFKQSMDMRGPPEYCQDGTVTHLNYDRIW